MILHCIQAFQQILTIYPSATTYHPQFLATTTQWLQFILLDHRLAHTYLEMIFLMMLTLNMLTPPPVKTSTSKSFIKMDKQITIWLSKFSVLPLTMFLNHIRLTILTQSSHTLLSTPQLDVQLWLSGHGLLTTNGLCLLFHLSSALSFASSAENSGSHYSSWPEFWSLYSLQCSFSIPLSLKATLSHGLAGLSLLDRYWLVYLLDLSLWKYPNWVPSFWPDGVVSALVSSYGTPSSTSVQHQMYFSGASVLVVVLSLVSSPWSSLTTSLSSPQHWLVLTSLSWELAWSLEDIRIHSPFTKRLPMGKRLTQSSMHTWLLLSSYSL